MRPSIKLTCPSMILAAALVAGCSHEAMPVTSVQEKVNFLALGSNIVTPPAMDANHVYVTTNNGQVRKISLADGKVEWTYSGRKDSPEELGWNINSPLVGADAVYALGSKNVLTCLDKRTGKKRWTKGLNDWAKGHTDKVEMVLGCFAIDPTGSRVIMGAREGLLFAIDGATGATSWVKDLGARLVAPPVFAKGMLYVTTLAGRVHALKAADGSDGWQVSKVVITDLQGRLGADEKAKATLEVKSLYNFKGADNFQGKGKIKIHVVQAGGDKALAKPVDVEITGEGGHGAAAAGVHTKKVTLDAVPTGSLKVEIKDAEGKLLDAVIRTVEFKKPEAPKK